MLAEGVIEFDAMKFPGNFLQLFVILANNLYKQSSVSLVPRYGRTFVKLNYHDALSTQLKMFCGSLSQSKLIQHTLVFAE